MLGQMLVHLCWLWTRKHITLKTAGGQPVTTKGLFFTVQLRLG
jgi:hypothetical protein